MLDLRDGPPVYIAGTARTPIGKFGGALAALSAPDLGALAVRAALERAGVPASSVNENSDNAGTTPPL